MLQTSSSVRRKFALLSATALAAGLASSSAFAQTLATPQAATPAVPEATEQVEVTGTRIQNTNANSQNPITVVTAKEIEQSQAQTIEDVLRKIPSIGSSGVNSQQNNAGDGADCTDIRNLGFEETLILVDGKRFVQTLTSEGFSCTDLNNIPLQMVDHIDVLKDGASTTYGADAVAGVVNIVLKKHYSGTTATLDGELPTRRGGSTGEVTVTSGANYDKGNFAIGVDYLNRAPISQGSRSWATLIDSADEIGVPAVPTSTYVPFGRVGGVPGGPFLADAQGNFRPFLATDKFNYAPFQFLTSSLEKESANATGSYDFNEYMTGYVETFFTHKNTSQQLAPEPVFLTIPSTSPYNPFGTSASLRQRALYIGPREFRQSSDTFQINAGIRGTLPYDISYDTYYQYGRSAEVQQLVNSVNSTILDDAIDAGGNPFVPTAATVKAAAINETDTSLYNLRDYGLDLSKKDVFELPYGSVGFALGFDHRLESGSFTPDNLVAAGETPEAPSQFTGGSFSTNEVYAEARVPILKDLPFAKELTVDLGGRYFSYNTAGKGTVWKVSANYSPIDDLRFRANLGTAFRQPSITDLFGGRSTSADGGTDPCDTDYQATNIYNAQQLSIIRANCAKAGVPSVFHSAGGVNGQINDVVGGNPNLSPERARTAGIGVIVKPRYIPNLAITSDYFRTKITNTISRQSLQTILDDCYESTNFPNSSACTTTDAAQRDNFGQVSNPLSLNANIGVTKTSGVDFGVTYDIPLGVYGAIALNNQMEWILKYEQQDPLTGAFTDINGTIEVQNPFYAYPRIKDNNSVTWSNGALSIDYTTRFISGMDFQSPDNVVGVNRVTKVANVFYHDIEGSYTYRNMTFTAGVDNILDLPAPFVPDGSTNTDPTIYDVVGRTVYLKTVFKF